MALFVGIVSYARPLAFKLCLLSLARTRIVKGVIAVIDVRDEREKERYINVVNKAREYGLEIIIDLSRKRRGSANARNRIFNITEQLLKTDDILILYDDDYVCPGAHALIPASIWLRDKNIGLVGGRVINLRRRRIDPDLYLDLLPGLADALTKLTGFIFLDTKHGPRYVNYTTPLMAMRVSVLKQGVRYDPNYEGTAYREESDLQLQVRRLGYKIVYEPAFYTYHLCLEEGGNRSIDDVRRRFYWKTRNNTYFIKKNKLSTKDLVLSSFVIFTYAAVHGPGVLEASYRGLKEGLLLARYYDYKHVRGTSSMLSG